MHESEQNDAGAIQHDTHIHFGLFIAREEREFIKPIPFLRGRFALTRCTGGLGCGGGEWLGRYEQAGCAVGNTVEAGGIGWGYRHNETDAAWLPRWRHQDFDVIAVRRLDSEEFPSWQAHMGPSAHEIVQGSSRRLMDIDARAAARDGSTNRLGGAVGRLGVGVFDERVIVRTHHEKTSK